MPQLLGYPAWRAKISLLLHVTQVRRIVSELSFQWQLSTTNEMAEKRNVFVASLIFYHLFP